jgi:hypothetical protein
MDEALGRAYEHVEKDIREAVVANRGNRSLMMHRLLLYPDHPFDIGEIWGKRFNPQTKHYESFLVTEAPELAKDVVYSKERRLIEDIRKELRQGRRCQVYATFTGEFDVAARLESVLRGAGIRVAVTLADFARLMRTPYGRSSISSALPRSPQFSHREGTLEHHKVSGVSLVADRDAWWLVHAPDQAVTANASPK